MKNFDINNFPKVGSVFIEASAGTGKTFTITLIFIKLILEKTPISEILIVSYTNATVQELKEKLRNTLEQSYKFINDIIIKNDYNENSNELVKDLKDLLKSVIKNKNKTEIENIKLHIEIALEKIDSIQVFTIHAFCKKILDENSFISDLNLSNELNNDDTLLRNEIVYEFCEKYIIHAPLVYLKFLEEIKFKIPDWIKIFENKNLFEKNFSLPIEVIKENIKEKKIQNNIHESHFKFKFEDNNLLNTNILEIYNNIIELEKICFLNLKKLTNKYKINKVDFKKDLEEHFEHFRKLSNKRTVSVIKIIDYLINYFIKEDDEEEFQSEEKDLNIISLEIENLLNDFYKIESIDFIKSETIKLWIEFRNTYIKLIELLKISTVELFTFLKDNFQIELKLKKTQSKIFTYHDLLTKTYNLLYESKFADELISNLRKQYKYLIIDEFQDTDSLQCDIFEKIFGTPKHCFYTIGDPKQSIYSFKGSDLNIYFKSKFKTNNHFTLSTNYRSNFDLVFAVNYLFSKNESNPFQNPKLIYNEISSHREKIFDKEKHILAYSKKYLEEKKENFLPPFVTTIINPETSYKNKENAEILIANHLTQNIINLISESEQNNIIYKDNKLRLSDIAILVRSKIEGKLIYDTLTANKIAAVLESETSIFETQTCKDLYNILLVFANSNKETSFGVDVRAAFCTETWGQNFEFIQKLSSNENLLNNYINEFYTYNKIWQNEGFSPFFNKLLYEKFLDIDSLQNLILTRENQNANYKNDSGERVYTNLLHIAELINQENLNECDEVLEFLYNSISNSENFTEEEEKIRQIRLRRENDLDTVNIITLHKSKGLEFPVVYCPFLWAQKENSKSDILNYYNENNQKHYYIFEFLRKLLELNLSNCQKIKDNNKSYYKLKIKDELKKIGKNDFSNFNELLDFFENETNKEIYSENMRLLYVALTRAKEKVYTYILDYKNFNTTPLFQLLCGKPYIKKIVDLNKKTKKESAQSPKQISAKNSAQESEKISAQSPEQFSAQNSKQESTKKNAQTSEQNSEQNSEFYSVIKNLEFLSETYPDSFRLLKSEFELDQNSNNNIKNNNYDLNTKEKIVLTPHLFTKEIQSSINIQSYSKIKRKIENENADKFEFENTNNNLYVNEIDLENNLNKENSELGIMDFPKGVLAGYFFHSLLETLDFKKSLINKTYLQEQIHKNLIFYNFPLKWLNVIFDQINILLTSSLIPNCDFNLSQISEEKKISELRFYYNINNFAIDFQNSKTNLMNGAIDLIFENENKFYILDWKSNFLGENLYDYSNEKLAENVLLNKYDLQYFIYLDALDYYLSYRLKNYNYNDNIGGVIYVYLRGVQANNSNGIFFKNPSLTDLTNFRNTFDKKMLVQN